MVQLAATGPRDAARRARQEEGTSGRRVNDHTQYVRLDGTACWPPLAAHHASTSAPSGPSQPGKPREGRGRVGAGKNGDEVEEAGRSDNIGAGLKGRRGRQTKGKYPRDIVKNENLSVSTSTK